MATEVAVEAPTAGAVSRRIRERLFMWRRVFQQNWNLFKASRIGVIGLGIMIAFVILALAAPFMGLRDPIRWTAPDEDLIAVAPFWTLDSSIAGTELVNAPPMTQPVAYRVLPDSFDPRADRLYVAAENRLYALRTIPDLKQLPPGVKQERNAWGTFNYFSVNETDDVPRTISVPPVVMNYGDYVNRVPDYELYLGTDDGKLFILRDTGDTLPMGSANVREIALDGGITGLAAYNGDMTAPAKILGTVNLARFDGSAWVVASIGGIDDVGEYTSLALNATDVPYVAYYDVSNGQPHVADYADGDWNPVGQLENYSADANVGMFTSLALDGSGYPRVAYYDDYDGDLKYAAWNGTTWNKTFVDWSAADVGQYASLALEPGTDNPRIAYYSTSGSLMFAACDTGCHDAANWTTEAVDGGGVGQYASLAVDATGVPHVAYYDATNRALKYATRPVATWVNETVDSGDVGQFASLALDGAGRPGVAYYDAGRRALKYANWTGIWSPQDVDVEPAADVGRYASLAYGPSGPAIAYHDATDLDMKFAAWSPGGWVSASVATQGHVGFYASLKFSSAGEPVIAYYSFITGRTTADLVVAGTSTGKLYAIDVGIPGTFARLPREKAVVTWDYRIRWVADLGSEVHIAASPMGRVSNVPLYAPCFDRDGTAVFTGTADGLLFANRTEDGSAYWGSPAWIGAPWTSAPVLQKAAEGPDAQREIVYAASNTLALDNPNTTDVDETGSSLLYAMYAESGAPLSQWITDSAYPAYGGPTPLVCPAGSLEKPFDDGNLTQPSVEGGTIYVGSTSGWLYAVRRDGVGELPPASTKWAYRDLSLLGLNPEFTSPAVVLNERALMLVTANHDGGTPSDPTDDRGLLYSFKLDGVISWRKTFNAPIPGKPASWTAEKSIQQAVWVSYGSEDLTGVASLSSTGQFLAPSPPSWVRAYPSGNQYWLGLDSQGRDIFSQVIWGSRIALLVGFMSAIFTVVLGVMVGLIAGYVGGKVEAVLMRFTDVILVLPALPLIITLAAVLGAGIWNIILVISLLGWPGIARIIRAEVLSLKERPFIDSARVTGASTTRIVFRHIAPNVMPLAFLYMTFAVSGAILTEAALSFIGLGDVNTMSWGIMLQLVSQSKALTAWWWLLPPGLAITMISLAFFLVGRAFDEIVNPRLRKR